MSCIGLHHSGQFATPIMFMSVKIILCFVHKLALKFMEHYKRNDAFAG